MNKTQQMLIESMHALVTPQFTGTAEEMMAAINYWVGMVSQLRSIMGIVSNYENKSAIIGQLEKEVAIMKAELENISAKAAPQDGTAAADIKLTQPLDVPAAAPVPPTAKPPAVDLSVRESGSALGNDWKRLAGIPADKADPLLALKSYKK